MAEEKRKPMFRVTPEDYRRMFSAPPGRRVLVHLLFQFFQEADDDEERLQRNLILRLLRNMGAIQPCTIEEIAEALVDAAGRHPIVDLHTIDELMELE